MTMKWRLLAPLWSGDSPAGAAPAVQPSSAPANPGSFFQPGAPAPVPGPGAPAPAAAPSAAGAPPPADPNRPEWLLEKYQSPEDQAKAYKDLYGKFSTKTDALKEQLRPEVEAALRAERQAPEKQEDYAYPDGFQAPAEGVDASLRKWAHENGLSKDAFASLIKDVHGQTVANFEAERAKLGTAEQATARVDAVNKWVSANVDEAHFGQVERILQTADGLAFIEHVMDGKRSAGFVPDPQGGQPPAPELTRASIRAIQSSPEYQAGDPVTVAKVRDMWTKFAALPEALQK